MSATTIRDSIILLMEFGMPQVDVFKFGVFDGQPVAAQQAMAMEQPYQHRFDVQVSSAKPHRATPISTKASYRVESRSVTIRIYTHLNASSDQAARIAARARVEENCDIAISRLCYPGLLYAPEIVSGMMCGAEDGSGFPRWEEVSEDWKRQLHLSRILGTIIVSTPRTPFF